MLAGLLGILVLALGSFQNNIAAEGAGRILDGHEELSELSLLWHFDSLTPEEFSADTATAEQVYQFLNEYQIAYETSAGSTELLPLYDERLLVLSSERWQFLTDPNDPANVKEIPEINRLLLPNYVYDPDTIPAGSTDQGAYRYPGAVVERTVNGDTYSTVLIPILDDTLNAESVSGIQRTFNVKSLITTDAYPAAQNWVGPVTIVKSPGSTGTAGALFKLVVFYPSQPASMIRLEIVRDAENRIISQTPVEANDNELDSQLGTLPDGYGFPDPALEANPQFGASSSRGRYGLGESFAFLKTIRPYRRVFETASLFQLQNDRLIAKYGFINQVDDPLVSGGTTLVEREIPDGSDSILRFLNPLLERGFDPSLDDSPDQRLRLVSDDSASSGNNQELELHVPRSGQGSWRVTVAAEFEPKNGSWETGHVLELWLLRNGVREQLLAEETLPSSLDGTTEEIQLFGQTIITASADDVDTVAVDEDTLQVRVYSKKPGVASYDVQLTDASERNYYTYEYLGDQ